MTEGPHVIIHTDGACSGNPGPGGWGAILTFGEHEKELKGGEPHTTNNRMELMAAIAALEALKKPSTVELHTDSKYVHDGISKWIHGWKRNGWKTADKKPVKNMDLWQRLDAAIQRARGALALGQGPRRPRAERARRPARRRGDRGNARGAEMKSPLPAFAGRGLKLRRKAYRLFSRLSAPETSALPGASSTLSVFTTPSSTTMA